MDKFTTASFLKKKKNKEKITMLTAYDYTTAKLLDESGVDTLLVGDSLGMVMLGYDDTIKVTVDDIIHHSKAVARGVKNAFVVADMPFLSYNISIEDAVKNAGRLIQEGNASAIKLEGGFDVLEQVRAIVRAQIPVMGHIGLTPQSVNIMGGYKVQGKNMMDAKKIIEEAKALESAGAFAIVLECVPEELAKLISEIIDIPTIGIGAGKYCDGQVLVVQDALGMYNDLRPKFVKRFGDIGDSMKKAVKEYIKEVETQSFPAEEHKFKIDKEIIDKLKEEKF